MHAVDPKTPLLALNGAAIRRVAVDWRDALRTVGTIWAANPTAPLGKVLDAAASTVSNAEGDGMTLGDALIDALLTGKAAEECNGREKLKRWELALALRGGTPIDVVAEDLLFLDAALAATYKAAVYGPARDALHSVTR